VHLVREQHIAAVQVCKDFNISRSTLHCAGLTILTARQAADAA